MTYALTVDEFVEMVRPEIERQIDAQIIAEPDLQGRLAMMRCRGVIISKAIDQCRIDNLKHRLAEAETRLRPRLVETPKA